MAGITICICICYNIVATQTHKQVRTSESQAGGRFDFQDPSPTQVICGDVREKRVDVFLDTV